MYLVAATFLLIVYVLVRWRFRRLTVLPDTGHVFEEAQRGRKRMVDAGSSGDPAVGRTGSLRDRLYIPDGFMLRGNASFQAYQIFFSVLAALMVFFVTAFFADKRAATLAMVCYLVVTALPHSWSYSSFWGGASGSFLLAGFMMAVIAKVLGSPLYGALSGSCLVFGALLSGMPLAVVTVPLTLAVPMLMYRYRLSMDPKSFTAFLAATVLVAAVFAAAQSPLLRAKRTHVRSAYFATGPFLRLTLPFWTLSVVGLFVLPPALGWMVAAWLAGLTAGALLSRTLLPKNLLGLVPIAAVVAGIALDRLVFFAAPPMNVYLVFVLAVVTVWFIFCMVALWLHGWRMTDRQSLEVVAAPFAKDAVAGRTCGEFLGHQLKAGCKVMNLTGLSSIVFYAPDIVSIGATAWLADETADLPGTVSDTISRHVPDAIVTDETRCPVLSLAAELPAGYTFARIIEGRYAVYAREDVLAETRVAEDDNRAELTIVVVAYNGIEATRRCLRSIARTVDMPYELVLVDNGSTDATSELLDHVKRARVVRLDENRGYAAGVNVGVAAACDHELVLLLHNDVVLTEGCVSRMVHTMYQENAAAVGPQAAVARPPQRVPGRPFRHIIDLEAYAATNSNANRGRVLGTDSLGGFCMLVRKDVFDTVSGFDEGFNNLLYSDIDFCRRLAEHDVRFVVALDTFVGHTGAIGWIEQFRQGTSLDDTFRRSQREFSSRWQVVPELEPSDTLKVAEWRARAGGLLEANRPIDALRLLMEAARVAPTDPVVYNDIGAVLWAAGRHKEAFGNFLRAVEMNPGSAAAANLCDAAETLDRTDEVADRLRTAQHVIDLGLDV